MWGIGLGSLIVAIIIVVLLLNLPLPPIFDSVVMEEDVGTEGVLITVMPTTKTVDLPVFPLLISVATANDI